MMLALEHVGGVAQVSPGRDIAGYRASNPGSTTKAAGIIVGIVASGLDQFGPLRWLIGLEFCSQ
jgi:hypothetical protein